jgi:nitrogen fixation protein NifU and related proteins
MDMYRTQILEHCKDPHNKGTLKNPDITYKEKNPLCGDEIQIDINVDDKGKVNNIKFSGHGCAISQATASLLTDEAKQLTISDIRQLKKEDILDLLGIQVAAMRVKCAMLSLHVMKKGILQYQAKKLR